MSATPETHAPTASGAMPRSLTNDDSAAGNCDSASAAFITSAPRKIMKIIPVVTAVS